MIPYFSQPAIHIGPLTIHAFSVLLIGAVLLARRIVSVRAGRLALDRQVVAEFCIWGLIPGFVAAHVGSAIIPRIPRFLAHPSMLWNNLSGIYALPGIVGGLLVALIWARLRGLSGFEILRILDVITYSLPFAWILGRIGCFLAHDHRGLYTNSWIGVRFPEGTRYDLALTELLFLIPFGVLFYILGRRTRPVGFIFGLYSVGYGLFRVWQDTLLIQPQSFLRGRYADTFGGLVMCLIGLIGWAFMAWYHFHERMVRETPLDSLIPAESR